MSIGIFVRSFDGDAAWLRRTMPINLQLCKGYDDFVVTGISSQCRQVMDICDKNGVKFVPHEEASLISTGYVNQQYTKLCADLLIPDCDYILYLDSDVLCLEEHDAAEWLERYGKPQMLYSEWSHVGDATCWKKPTWDAIGSMPKYEYMRRLPLIYPSSVVKGCREHIERRHNRSLAEYLAPLRTFSEFNALGHYAYEHMNDAFEWTHAEEVGAFVPENKFKQFWSHGNMEQQIQGFQNGQG